MNDEPVSAQAEGEALSESEKFDNALHFNGTPEPAWFDSAKTDVERVIAAVEAWYAAHFHAAALAGRAPITADDKAALIQHVADAVAPTATQE
jgi:hypothetical protein